MEDRMTCGGNKEMINYSILNTLHDKELTKTTTVLQKRGFIKSKVIVQYEQGWHTLLEEAFEHILHKEIGKMPRDDEDMVASWIIRNEHEVEYEIVMPVELTRKEDTVELLVEYSDGMPERVNYTYTGIGCNLLNLIRYSVDVSEVLTP